MFVTTFKDMDFFLNFLYKSRTHAIYALWVASWLLRSA